MGIKLNVGASPIWHKEGWMILDHKASRVSKDCIRGDAVNINLENESCSLIFCSHTLEHIPHFKIQKVLMEFSRVLEIGGTMRILVPDLRKIAEAYVKRDEDFFKQALEENEAIRRDLGMGGMLMNFIVSPGQDTVLLSRNLSEFIGGYAHIYAYDFEMLETLLSDCGFDDIQQMEFSKSSVSEMEEPLHVDGFEKKWQTLNKKFYKKNGLIHEYKNGHYHINFSITGFDRSPITSLIVEAKKNKNMTIEEVLDINGEEALNYNRYGFSLLYDEEVKRKLKLLNILI